METGNGGGDIVVIYLRHLLISSCEDEWYEMVTWISEIPKLWWGSSLIEVPYY